MDYYNILNIKPNYNKMYIFFIITLVGLFIFTLNLKIYDTFKLKGIVNNNLILINLPIKYSDTIVKGKFVKIDNKKYSYQIKNISTIKIDKSNLIEYQTIEIKVSKKIYQNEIINLIIYFQKEKLINKIINCLERS